MVSTARSELKSSGPDQLYDTPDVGDVPVMTTEGEEHSRVPLTEAPAPGVAVFCVTATELVAVDALAAIEAVTL